MTVSLHGPSQTLSRRRRCIDPVRAGASCTIMGQLGRNGRAIRLRRFVPPHGTIPDVRAPSAGLTRSARFVQVVGSDVHRTHPLDTCP